MTAHGTSLSGAVVIDRGTAVARSCEFGGPVGHGGLGWWSVCQADVQWAERGSQRVEFTGSQLTESDVDREVPVVLYRIGKGAGKGNYTGAYRADFEPDVLKGALLGVPPMAVGGVILLLLAVRIGKAVKRARSGSVKHARGRV